MLNNNDLITISRQHQKCYGSLYYEYNFQDEW